MEAVHATPQNLDPRAVTVPKAFRSRRVEFLTVSQLKMGLWALHPAFATRLPSIIMARKPQ